MAAPVLVENTQSEIDLLLQSCDLFQEANDEALEFAKQRVEQISFQKGDCIVLENEFNQSVYFVVKGSIEIVSYLQEENRIQRLALKKPGSSFAEFSVLTNSPRSGSAFAFEDCTLLKMNGEDFLVLLKSFPSVSMRLVKSISQLNSNVETANEMVPFYKPEQLQVSQEVLAYVPVAVWQKLHVIPVSFRSGLLTVILTNPFNAEFYQYIRQSFPNLEIAVHLIGTNEFETALLTAKKSLKSTATSTSRLSVAGDLSQGPSVEGLQKSELFGTLKESILSQMIPHIQPIVVKAGTIVSKPGEAIEAYHLIVSGSLQFSRPIAKTKAVAPVMVLESGQGFGEVQLITQSPHPYFIRALEETVLWPIPSAIIEQLLRSPSFTISLTKALARRLRVLGHTAGVKYFQPDPNLNFADVANLLPPALISEEKILPLKLVDNEVIVGIVEADNAAVTSAVSRYLLKYRLKTFAITEDQFKTWFAQFKMYFEAPAEAAPVAGRKVEKPAIDVIKWIDHILFLGLHNRASDLHFEPGAENFQIRFRIDGVLQEHTERLDLETGKEVISRLKILADMDISQQYLPQDGQLKTELSGVEVMARASSVPVRYGEKIVLRLIRSQSAVVPLSMLAPNRRLYNLLRSVTKCRQGLFLVTGPTGSGKTTSLYSMLGAINDVGVNVTTLEDPVEMEISGFNQIEVDRKRGLDFSAALRSVLRQDPNVIMVGEIRDEESAKIVFDASMTGHLVFSTLHTNSSLDIAPRLLELGVTPAMLSGGLLGVLSQRLLRANCKKCLSSRPALPSEQAFFHEVLKLDEPPKTLAFSVGCPACSNTGYHHRLPVFEVWRNTPAMRQALVEGQSVEAMLLLARQDGFETLLESGLRMVLSGLTSLEEVRRVLYQF